MVDNSFFAEQKIQSYVKSTIVSKYFDAWSKVIIRTQKRYPRHSQKIAYIDLFAGPGRYKDGTQSTPLQILRKAIEDPALSERLVAIFNDKDENTSRALKKQIAEVHGLEKLQYRPKVYNEEVGENIVKMFESMKLIPTLFFVDPWGYKGISLRLVNSVLKDWGCDAIFFFNYNRINMGIDNRAVARHMAALFGEEQAQQLRDKIRERNSRERELLIIEELCQTLKRYGSRYVLPFRFTNDRGERTSHHLIFVSKSFRGYEIMKGIMARESSGETQGVPSFEYNPADFLPEQSLLFQLSRPLDDLKEDLINKFKGSRLTMKEIYEKHNLDTPYTKKNYKLVLRELFEQGCIKAANAKGKPPRKGTFGDEIRVTFPK